MSDRTVQAALEHVQKKIDEEVAPKVMTKRQYRDFLVDLKDNIESRLEAVEDELREEGDEEE